jgi:hypothetical protein
MERMGRRGQLPRVYRMRRGRRRQVKAAVGCRVTDERGFVTAETSVKLLRRCAVAPIHYVAMVRRRVLLRNGSRGRRAACASDIPARESARTLLVTAKYPSPSFLSEPLVTFVALSPLSPLSAW